MQANAAAALIAAPGRVSYLRTISQHHLKWFQLDSPNTVIDAVYLGDISVVYIYLATGGDPNRSCALPSPALSLSRPPIFLFCSGINTCSDWAESWIVSTPLNLEPLLTTSSGFHPARAA